MLDSERHTHFGTVSCYKRRGLEQSIEVRQLFSDGAIRQYFGVPSMALKLRYRDDGRAYSPVVRANAKFCGSGRSLCADVRFKDLEQLDTLIEVLTKLREFPSDGFDHVHLQDATGGNLMAQPHSVEVTFWHPSVKRDYGLKLCVAKAKKFFESQTD
jgi:hypothetical protein